MTEAIAVSSGHEVARVAQFGEMSVQSVIDRKRKIQEVMNAVMRDGEHYGTIPGCGDKPTLLKAGAETLAMTFALRPTFAIERIDLPGGHREYQVICTLTHIPSDLAVAQGVGAATTLESKHRWRNAARLCPACGKSTIIKGKEEWGGGWLCFQKKGGCGEKWADGAKEIEGQATGRTENADPADQYNTVLKMAKKRAQVDATLTATGASDVLAQDLEDLPPGSRDADLEQPKNQQPKNQQPKNQQPKNQQPLTDQALGELLAAVGLVTTASGLEEVGARIAAAAKTSAQRDRLAKAYADQLALIRAAVKENEEARGKEASKA